MPVGHSEHDNRVLREWGTKPAVENPEAHWYIGARLGPGPRDGLMTGLHAKLGWPIWLVRTIIEVTVLAVGWILGGNVGIGTVAFALLIGPIANITLPLLRVPELRVPPLPTVELGEEVAR